MRTTLQAGPLIALLISLQPASPLQAQAAATEKAAVRAVVDSALAAVTRADFVAFTDLMLDSAVTFSAGMRDGQYRLQFSTRAQQRAFTARGQWVERGFRAEVRVSGPLAMAWVPYDFYLNGKWSHCGVDAFTLLKEGERWRIATLLWSVEQPPACARHPDGPPPGAVADQ